MQDESTFESFGLSATPAQGECRQFVGQSIDGRYILERTLGEGGFGCVFLARQKSPSRQVAVKVQKHAGRESHRMAKEADLLARLDDRGIARVFEAGEWESPTGSRVFVAMELIADGQPLHRYCIRCGLSVSERLSLFREVCRAVGVAHRAGIVHRDLKPSNILVDKHGQPRVIDFGISKVVASPPDGIDGSAGSDPGDSGDFTKAGVLLGTAPYAAPEQRHGEATPRADVHALGSILAHDLFSDRPDGPPPWLGPLVSRCLSTTPAARPATADELATDLDGAIRRRPRRWRAFAVAATAILGAALTLRPFAAGRAAPAPGPLSLTLLEEGSAVAGAPATSCLARAIGTAVVISSGSSPATPQTRLSLDGVPARHVAFSGSGTILAASHAGGWTAWDMVALKESTWPLFTIRGRGSAATHDGLLALSPDGATLVAQDGLSGVVAFDTRSGAIRGEAAFTNPREPAMISGLAFPANGDDVIVGLSDGSLCRWSISSGRHDPLDTMHTAGRVLVAANRDGSRLASCGSDGRVVLLDGQSASVIGESPCLPHALSAICFADDNDIVVAMPAADGRGTSVIRLSARPGRQLVCSGSAAVSAAVGQLAFTGSALVGMTSPFGDARGLASPAVDNAALPRAAPREAALGQALR